MNQKLTTLKEWVSPAGALIFTFASGLFMYNQLIPHWQNWEIKKLQTRCEALEQDAKRSVVFKVQDELNKHGLRLVVMDTTGRAQLLKTTGE